MMNAEAATHETRERYTGDGDLDVEDGKMRVAAQVPGRFRLTMSEWGMLGLPP